MTDRLNLDATFKILNESIASGTSKYDRCWFYNGILNFDTGICGMVLGMCISNFGPEARYG